MPCTFVHIIFVFKLHTIHREGWRFVNLEQFLRSAVFFFNSFSNMTARKLKCRTFQSIFYNKLGMIEKIQNTR